MVAARDLSMGEVVYKEEPLVVGPNQEGSAICLGCLASVDCSVVCEECGYPVCDSQCSQMLSHKEECEILSMGNKQAIVEGEINKDAYHVITPLRLLLMMKKNGPEGRLAEGLVHHYDERKSFGDYFVTAEEHIVRKLKEGLGQESWDAEEIQNAVGRLELNAYEIQSYITAGYRGLFPLSSLVNHSCLPNCCHIWTKEPPYTAKLVTDRDIKAGEQLTVSYLPHITCSLRRRRTLEEGWFFQCQCKRCEDPLEMGAQTNTLVCQTCRSSSLLPTTPLDLGAAWKCNNCSQIEDADTVVSLVEEFLTETVQLAEKDRYNSTAWLELLSRCLTKFHPRHEVVCEVAKWTVPILGRGSKMTFSDFPRNILETKESLAAEYLAVLDIVEAGLSRNRAKTTFELVDTRLYLTSLNFKEGRISKEKMVGYIKEFVAQLDEVSHVLSLLTPGTTYEEMVLCCVSKMKRHCDQFLLSIKSDCFTLGERQ